MAAILAIYCGAGQAVFCGLRIVAIFCLTVSQNSAKLAPCRRDNRDSRQHPGSPRPGWGEAVGRVKRRIFGKAARDRDRQWTETREGDSMTTYTLDDVAAGRSERADAPEPHGIDPNAWQEAAERVAQWHIDNCTPEFVEWLDDSYAAGRIEMQTIAAILCALPREAHLVQQAKGIADTILGDFRVFVANADDYSAWPMARRIAAEVRRGAE